MPSGLGKFADVLGDDFDLVIDAFRSGMTPEIENMLMSTMDSMLFDTKTFANSIEKHVTTLTARGVSTETIKQTLNNDMREGGRIFGKLRNDIKASTHDAVNQAGRIGQFEEYKGFDRFMWVTVAGHKVCPDCANRAGAILTYEEWEGEGLPGTGWSVCGGFCYCILDPIGQSGKVVQAPDVKEVSRKSTSEKALKGFDYRKPSTALEKKQWRAYNKGLKLESKSSKEILARKGLSHDDAMGQLAEHRAKLQAAGPDSKTLNFNQDTPVRGMYGRDRAVMHNRIARNITQKGQIAAREADFLMTGGYPGSGKSTMLNKAFPGWQDKFVHIDSDYIKQLLASLDDTTISWNAAKYHEEADDIIKLIFQKSFNENRHILFDGTMKSGDKMLKLISKAHDTLNYNPYIAYADLPMHKTIERAILRSTGPTGATGRFVEPAYIITHMDRNLKTYNMLKETFEDVIQYTKYDNDVPLGFDPILLESSF